MELRLALVISALMGFISVDSKNYKATWKSLETRPIPAWYDEAKFGIFAHWGIYSAIGIGSDKYSGEWIKYHWKITKQKPLVDYMKKHYPGMEYEDFVSNFTAKNFNPDSWADLLKKSGARYFVITSKHHDGFTLWNSSKSPNWNAVDVGPKRDLISEIAHSVRNRTNIKFGLYYSLYEWFNPMYISDKKNHFKSHEFVDKKVIPELHDLINTFKPDIIWSDGDWDAPAKYWRSKDFLAWLYNKSPVKDKVLTNDRWGYGCMCHHGGVLTCADRYNPVFILGEVQKRKWENCMTIDRASWGFRYNATEKDYLSMKELLKTLVKTVSFGGNLLMNIGPMADGSIPEVFQNRLLGMGKWLKVNGEAIYGTKPWRVPKDDGDVWYTSKGDVVYAIVLSYPDGKQLRLSQPVANSKTTVHHVGKNIALKWNRPEKNKINGMIIQLPQDGMKEGWVMKLIHVK